MYTCSVHPICRIPLWPSVMVGCIYLLTGHRGNRPMYHLAASASSFVGPCPCWVCCWRGFVDQDSHRCGSAIHVINTGHETVPFSEVLLPSTSKMVYLRKKVQKFCNVFHILRFCGGKKHPPKMGREALHIALLLSAIWEFLCCLVAHVIFATCGVFLCSFWSCTSCILVEAFGVGSWHTFRAPYTWGKS